MSFHAVRGVPAAVAFPARRRGPRRARRFAGASLGELMPAISTGALEPALADTTAAISSKLSSASLRLAVDSGIVYASRGLVETPTDDDAATLDVTSRVLTGSAVDSARSGGTTDATETPPETAASEATALATADLCATSLVARGCKPIEPGVTESAEFLGPRWQPPPSTAGFSMWPPTQWPWWAWVGAGIGAVGLLSLIVRR